MIYFMLLMFLAAGVGSILTMMATAIALHLFWTLTGYFIFISEPVAILIISMGMSLTMLLFLHYNYKWRLTWQVEP